MRFHGNPSSRCSPIEGQPGVVQENALCLQPMESTDASISATHNQKKRKVAEGLHTEDAEDEDKTPHDWEGYMDRVAGSCDCLSG